MEEKTENKKSESVLREEAVLKFWQENEIFKKSLKKDSPKGNYVFYDGPPFATGLPHYGHILGSTAKDVVGRYQTMQGYRVPRRWGWDCHGLPIENIVEKDLKVSGHKEIEALGVKQFVEHARSKVLTYVHDWKRTVDRIGRWVDFEGGYKTMDNTFIESVWWALAELQKKNLLYEGVRVLAYCPRCETPIANSEIAMDNSYKDITDISVYVKFELVDESGTYLLAWTTTPWTLPGNTAIAINKDTIYIKAKVGEDTVILAKELVEKVLGEKEFTMVEEFSGATLIGKKYKPVFSYFENKEIQNKENIWKVWHADFVTTEKGTGIAHMAPAFGEEDMMLAKKENIPWIIHVDPTGKFTDEVTDFAGQLVKPKSDQKDGHQATDIEIIKYLAHRGSLFAKEKIIHSYPHCYRCETPLYYYALPSWFVNIQSAKAQILEKAKEMNWVPEYLKDGRFHNILEGAPDWTISRNRYWASPLPFWKSKNGDLMVVSSLEELKKKTKKSGNKYFVMRHGGTEGNAKGVISFKYQESDNLTEEGKTQVERTVEALQHEKIDLIISSPFTRTRETTEILREKLDLSDDQIIFADELHEIDGGDFDGKTWEEYHQYILQMGEDWFVEKIPGGESLKDVGKRTGKVLYELENNYKDKNILIVTHGGPAWALFVNAGLFSPVNKEYQPANSHVFVPEFKRFHNAEVRTLPFVPLPHNDNYELDIHRPYIDEIILVNESGEEYHRIPEVIDCWFESGSMPFAQDHYPFERPNWPEENFPADFVAEYIAQTRTWFYYTHVLSTILFDHAPFKHVVTTGTLLAEDGEKMSKSKGNYPDPWILFDKYGVDALRLFLMGSPLMRGEDMNFSEKAVDDIYKKIVSRLNNVLVFYELYREIGIENEKAKIESENVLDQWIIARLNQTMTEVTIHMNMYQLTEAVRPFDLFVDDLSTWYLRRSRDRIKDGDTEAKATLYYVIKTLAQIMAPFAPFTAEDIWRRLRSGEDEESVHLTKWPEISQKSKVEIEKLLEEMQVVRDLCTVGNALRKKSNIPLRQPLAFFFVTEDLTDEFKEIIKDELNVKAVEKGTVIIFDERITPELKAEGDYREFVRGVQELRKKAGLTPSDRVTVTLSANAEPLVRQFMEDFKKTVLADKVVFTENDGEKVKTGEDEFSVTLEK